MGTLESVKNKFLKERVNFGLGSAFSKGPGLGPGSLYKVCLREAGKKRRFDQLCLTNVT